MTPETRTDLLDVGWMLKTVSVWCVAAIIAWVAAYWLLIVPAKALAGWVAG